MQRPRFRSARRRFLRSNTNSEDSGLKHVLPIPIANAPRFIQQNYEFVIEWADLEHSVDKSKITIKPKKIPGRSEALIETAPAKSGDGERADGIRIGELERRNTDVSGRVLEWKDRTSKGGWLWEMRKHMFFCRTFKRWRKEKNKGPILNQEKEEVEQHIKIWRDEGTTHLLLNIANLVCSLEKVVDVRSAQVRCEHRPEGGFTVKAVLEDFGEAPYEKEYESLSTHIDALLAFRDALFEDGVIKNVRSPRKRERSDV
ncbi:hypothetical protein BS50DRAFT_642549 [Corynespora cassiicola Philippines]|uniref:Uncharacterized protein n=1 Tax=Corynespora cassiicola Philippines TaxID=1448308 RepID=A0A2T2P9I1_CORCC|nr:hypothetical protein BS50DRAFT_642549 [Corynespora cassiicola Philippines]